MFTGPKKGPFNKKWGVFVHLLVRYDPKDRPQHGGASRESHNGAFVNTVIEGSDMSEEQYIFATIGEEEEEIYPPTIEQIAAEQRRNRVYKPYFKGTSKNSKKKLDKRISLKVIDDTEILVYDHKRLVIPGAKMQSDIISWYHHYLQHPGENRLEETLTPIMYWPGMRYRIRKYVKTCYDTFLPK